MDGMKPEPQGPHAAVRELISAAYERCVNAGCCGENVEQSCRQDGHSLEVTCDYCLIETLAKDLEAALDAASAQEPQGWQPVEDYDWARARVVQLAANAYADARVHGLKLLKGFGYPDAVMSHAQDYRALDIFLRAHPAPPKVKP